MARSIADSPEHKLAMAKLADKYATRAGRSRAPASGYGAAAPGRSKADLAVEVSDLASVVRVGLREAAQRSDRVEASDALHKLYVIALQQTE